MSQNYSPSMILPLSQTQRLDAYENVRKQIVRSLGAKPDRASYSNYTTSQYPSYVNYTIITFCVVALVAAFIPSAIRLYHIGSQTFANSIDHPASVHLVGLSVVIMAEVSQLVFSLSLAVLGASKTSRRLLYFSMLVATAIALVGNVQVALPDHWTNPFAWLEAVAPPILVLSLAYVLKEQMLSSIQTRFANEQAYQQALKEWNSVAEHPETHPRYEQFLANAIRDEIIRANKRKKIIKENQLTLGDWRTLVYRELEQENWFSKLDNATASSGRIEEERLQTVPLAVTSNGHKPT